MLHDPLRPRRAALAILTWLVLAAASASAQAGITWTFSNSLHRLGTGETAVWDHAAGVLRAPAYASSPTGSLTLAGANRGIALSGPVAYVGAGYDGVHAVDVSDPGAPVLLDTYDTPGYVYQVDVRGDFVFVADWASGLRILDASDPTNLRAASFHLTFSQVLDVVVDGSIAYLADHSDGVQAVDVSDPYAPVLLGSIDTVGARDLDLQGDVLYVADATGGILAIDVTDPSALSLLGQLDTSGNTRGIAVDGDHAYVAEEGTGLIVVDVEDPSQLGQVATLALTGECRRISVQGDTVFLANAAAGLVVIDVTDPAAPVLQETLDTDGSVYDVMPRGRHAFVADSGAGLEIFRIHQPLSTRFVRDVDTTSDALDVEIDGNVAYVAGDDGLLAFDVSDPRRPTLLNAGSSADLVELEVAGNAVFALDDLRNLRVYDVSDPAAPVSRATRALGGFGLSMHLDGNLLFVGTRLSPKVVVVDVSDPFAPSILDSVFGETWDLATHGKWLFAAEAYAGFTVYDAAVPSDLVEANSIATAYGATILEVHGDHLLVGGLEGFEVYDISTPVTPVLVGSVAVPDADHLYGFDRVDHGGYAHGTDAIYTLDLSDPTAPQIYAASWDPAPASPSGIAAKGSFLYVTTVGSNPGDDGLSTFTIAQREVEDAFTDYLAHSVSLPSVDDAVRVRMDVSIAGGSWTTRVTNWPGVSTGTSLLPDGTWSELPEWHVLGWRVTMRWSPLGPPLMDELTLAWLNAPASIDALVDAPNDQGGWARMTIERSGYDFLGDDRAPVTGYQIYREVDDPAAVPASSGSDDVFVPEGTGLGRLVVSDESFARTAHATFPSGTWEAVAWVAARQQDSYTVAVPTVADGPSHPSRFVVTTHTTDPTHWTTSTVRSVITTDDIAPGVPADLHAAYDATSVQLTWSASVDEDFQFHRVYRGTSPDFVPDASTLLSETAGTSFDDLTASPWGSTYKVTAVDHAGNESAPAEVLLATAAPVSAGRALVLGEPRPNPFNPATSLRFTVPRAGAVDLVVHDLSGRRVRTLVDGRLEAGAHEVRWDGRDDQGHGVASGVYLARLRSGAETMVRRLTLVK